MSTTSQSTSRSTGIGFTGALFLVFLVLKLTGVITWSWWAVTAPLWGAFALFLAVIMFIAVVAFVTAVVKR
ncbi:hypothetical protein CH305_18270 [Rhodococcus sp. 15-649-2-2]|uniref:hypothetical protein n=1 Tax=Rhodococcus sp. 15-649-2-2 TaxID=2023140 RepID=UPI000B9B0A02|nr:hypothetical protein [Rhodococcus sp. 15-649-2-2]OZE77183.1 hypothetical protein CH305_18270 [Rhodococcus sp. 15-649-2-2]